MTDQQIVILVVLGIVVMLPLLIVIGIYNALVTTRNHVRESWSNVDTELKRRYNLIPNLVATVKGYAQHERETLQSVVEARNHALAAQGSPQQQAGQENLLIDALRRLLVVVESYPDLKASQNFLQLQEELANTEDRIQAARRFYNANVRDLSNRVEMFPSNIVASLFKFERAEYFEVEDLNVRRAPNVSI